MPAPLRISVAVLLLAAFASAAGADDVAISPEQRAFFENKIRPVLAKHCYECHAEGSKELGGQLLLDTRAGMRAGGQSGSVVAVGKPDESLLTHALRYDGVEMPPEKPLPESVIHDFEEWIRMGAQDPRDGAPPPDQEQAFDLEAVWSFLPRTNPAPPEVQDAAWVRDPIDRFILARLEAAGLKPTSVRCREGVEPVMSGSPTVTVTASRAIAVMQAGHSVPRPSNTRIVSPTFARSTRLQCRASSPVRTA
jgi:hypothetical protein